MLSPTPPKSRQHLIPIARVLVPRLRSIRLLSDPDPSGWSTFQFTRAGPHRTLIHFPLHALDEEDLNLDFAHRWWHARRHGGLLPPRSAVDTPEFRLLVSGLHWIDVRAAEAECWQLGPLLPSLTGLTAEAVAAAATSLRADLQAIRFTGAVLVQDLFVPALNGASIWRQLVLPHADDGIRVRELLVVMGKRRIPYLPDASSSSASAGSTPG